MQFSTSSLLAFAVAAFAASSSATSCYTSGQWAQRADGYNRAATACSSIAGRITAGGTYNICVNGNNAIRWNFAVTNKGNNAYDMSQSDCYSNLKLVIDDCGGQNADTRGGNNDVNIGGTTWGFKADPNAGAC